MKRKNNIKNNKKKKEKKNQLRSFGPNVFDSYYGRGGETDGKTGMALTGRAAGKYYKSRCPRRVHATRLLWARYGEDDKRSRRMIDWPPAVPAGVCRVRARYGRRVRRPCGGGQPGAFGRGTFKTGVQKGRGFSRGPPSPLQ